MSTDTRPDVRTAWRDRLRSELHGHRKKLLFFLDALGDFRRERGADANAISVLEVGCSNGRNISLPLAEQGYRVTGVDLHAPSIARANADSTFANARFICQDATAFVSEESFDVIILSDILEHIDDPFGMLTLARKLMRDDGMVLICIPNGYGPAELERRFVERTGLSSVLRALRGRINRAKGRAPVAYNEDSGHVQYFSMEDIQGLISRAGLKTDECVRGALFGGGLTYPVGMMLPRLADVSLRLADVMPYRLVSTWYFRCSIARGA